MCAAVVELTSVLAEDHLGAFRFYNDRCRRCVFARFMATYYNIILPRQTGSLGVQRVGIYSCKKLKTSRREKYIYNSIVYNSELLKMYAVVQINKNLDNDKKL